MTMQTSAGASTSASRTGHRLHSIADALVAAQRIAAAADIAQLLDVTIELTGAARAALLIERADGRQVEAWGPAGSAAPSPDTAAALIREAVLTHQVTPRRSAEPELCVPLLDEGQLIGVLHLAFTQCDARSDGERASLLALLAPQIALALRHARHTQALEQRAAELGRLLAETRAAAELQRGIAAQARAETGPHDQTEMLSQRNADLIRALQLRDDFLAVMSHELRTPLNAIMGAAEALGEEIYGPLTDQQHAVISRAQQSGEHLLRIISDMLDTLQLESGKATLTIAPVDVEACCQSAFESVANQAMLKGVRLRFDAGDSARRVPANQRRLAQILTALLDNAIKFTPAGGAAGLEITADVEQERLCFTVWDTGIGIAALDHDRIFQPFTQADVGLTRRYDGLGLGLSLARQLVDMHGGGITLASAPGHGSRFTVSLPWIAAAPALPAPQWQHPPRLVLAEDHEAMLQHYAQRLRELGCEVALARSGAEALALARSLRPDAVVIDLQLPGLDGLTAIRQLRADPDLAATPAVALTALALPGGAARCLDAGAAAYLCKPVSISALAAAVAEAIGAAPHHTPPAARPTALTHRPEP